MPGLKKSGESRGRSSFAEGVGGAPFANMVVILVGILIHILIHSRRRSDSRSRRCRD